MQYVPQIRSFIRKGSQLEGPLLGRAVSVGGTINKEDIKLVGTLIERAVSWIFNRKGSQLDL